MNNTKKKIIEIKEKLKLLRSINQILEKYNIDFPIKMKNISFTPDYVIIQNNSYIVDHKVICQKNASIIAKLIDNKLTINYQLTKKITLEKK